MKLPTPFLLPAALALAAAVLAPPGSRAQIAPADDRATGALIENILVQQKTLTENQAKIDEQLAALGEALRVARIYESRSGGHRLP